MSNFILFFHAKFYHRWIGSSNNRSQNFQINPLSENKGTYLLITLENYTR